MSTNRNHTRYGEFLLLLAKEMRTGTHHVTLAPPEGVRIRCYNAHVDNACGKMAQPFRGNEKEFITHITGKIINDGMPNQRIHPDRLNDACPRKNRKNIIYELLGICHNYLFFLFTFL